MKLVWISILLVTVASAKPMPTKRERAVALAVALGELDRIEPARVAKILGTAVDATDHVTPYRREITLAPTDVFARIVVIIGGKDDSFRAVVLEPREPPSKVELEQPLLDAPHATNPRFSHGPNGPIQLGTDHRFRVRAGELVGVERPAGGIAELTVTTNVGVRADAPSLRALRRPPSEL